VAAYWLFFHIRANQEIMKPNLITLLSCIQILLVVPAPCSRAAEVDVIGDDFQKPGSVPPKEKSEQVAFPGAEGYGRFAKGGRNGDVYHVTSLEDEGLGSLRWGLDSTYDEHPRTIVFDVSGTIKLEKDLNLTTSNVTIAGQTAPGDGITLRDHTFRIKNCSDVIVRYIRVRLGDESKTSSDTIAVQHAHNVILDHLTATWGVDGIMDTYYLTNFTMQWSLFGEALNDSSHHKGSHAMLMSLRNTSGNVSLHHNLLFSSRNRHPTLGGGSPAQCNKDTIFDFRNNVLYNWSGSTNLGIGQFNLINNYYRPGPDTDAVDGHYPVRPKVEIEDVTVGYMSGTVFEWNEEWTRNNRLAMQWGVRDEGYPGNVSKEKFCLPEEPVEKADRPTTQLAAVAYELVLDRAGASLSRDAADKRVVRGIRDRTHRLIDSQREVGGWPNLSSQPTLLDTDRDGMPDNWETKYGFDFRNPKDRNGDHDRDGYTNLEEYLNSLVEFDSHIGSNH
jgi:hypothetical protein